jgi:hypothetical protein
VSGFISAYAPVLAGLRSLRAPPLTYAMLSWTGNQASWRRLDAVKKLFTPHLVDA